jgi:hypothetical protein
MMNAVELELQSAATRAFILADPEDLDLVRTLPVSDGAGGFIGSSETPLATQTARMIPLTDQVPEIRGSDGRMAVPEWVVLMEPGADMARYDRFTWRGTEWEIAQIHFKPDYEAKGDVIKYA